MDALADLNLQIAWGADEALDEVPIDRTVAAASTVPPPIPASASRVAAAPIAATPVARATECAGAAMSVDALRAALASFTLCPLAATATNLVFADGRPECGLVVVDDTPGPEEDLSGIPMVGPAGQLLNRMLASIGLDRSSVLITNLVPWRPPGGRPATEAEIAMCLPFLRRHLVLLGPRIVVTLGTAPSQALSGSEETIRRLRGKWQKLTLPDGSGGVAMLPMMHPATLLKTPMAKKDAWADLLALQERLKGE